MTLLEIPVIVLHGQVGFWDEIAYVAAAAIGVVVFVALVIGKKEKPEE